MRNQLFIKRFVLLSSFLFIALTNPVFSSRIQPQNDGQKIEATVKQFWKALGELDTELLKQTLAYPLTVAEETAEDSASEARLSVIQNAAEIDKELMRSNPNGEKRKGEFYGVTLANVKIQVLNDALAYMSYTIQLTDLGLKAKSKKAAQPFALLTVLKRDKPSGSWRIVFTNIPK